MLPFGIGFSEVVLILVVVLLVVGPSKLPDLARTLGKGMRTARRASRELRDALDVDDIRRNVYDSTVRPWQEATRIDDVYPDSKGTYRTSSKSKKQATAPPRGPNPATARATIEALATADAVDAASGDAAAEDPMHDPDEVEPSGPIGRDNAPGRPPSATFGFGDDTPAVAEASDAAPEGDAGPGSNEPVS